jgi:carbamoyltransferase
MSPQLPRVLEEVLSRKCRNREEDGLKNLVLSGGVVANVKLNQRCAKSPASKISHPSEHGRRRQRTGAALAVRRSQPTRERINDVYLGPQYSAEEISEALRRAAGVHGI